MNYARSTRPVQPCLMWSRFVTRGSSLLNDCLLLSSIPDRMSSNTIANPCLRPFPIRSSPTDSKKMMEAHWFLSSLRAEIQPLGRLSTIHRLQSKSMHRNSITVFTSANTRVNERISRERLDPGLGSMIWMMRLSWRFIILTWKLGTNDLNYKSRDIRIIFSRQQRKK